MAPHKSKLQQRYFQYLESQGKMPKHSAKEFDDASDSEHMPEEPHFADGGEVEDDLDYEEGHEEEFDSSGEPGTDDELEDEQPMEMMSRGGMVKKRMSKGGEVRAPGFAKALRKMY